MKLNTIQSNSQSFRKFEHKVSNACTNEIPMKSMYIRGFKWEVSYTILVGQYLAWIGYGMEFSLLSLNEPCSP